MDIGIIGAGAIGSFYAGMLSKAGHTVRMHARGEHLAAVRARGLEIRTLEGTFVTHPDAVADAAGIGAVEFVLVAVKTYSLDEVTPLVASAAGRGATIVPLLNGVDAAERLVGKGVPRSSIVGGLCQVSVFRTGPGVVEWRNNFSRVTIGEFDGSESPRVAKIADAMTSAGSKTTISREITRDLWRKFSMIVPMGVACGLSRTAMGPVLATGGGRMILQRSLNEIVAVSRAAGADSALSVDDETRALKGLFALEAPIMPSFLHDLVKGGPTEVESLCGAVSRMGRELGVATMVNDVAAGAFLAATTPG